MGPKKKSGKKKSGKKNGSSKGDAGKISATPVMSTGERAGDVPKQNYIVQIRDLEKQIKRYQRQCDEIELINRSFQNQFDQIATDKLDICEYLKEALEQKSDEISELNFELRQIHEARDAEVEMFEKQLKQLHAEFDEVKDQLTSENMIKSGQVSSMEEYKIQKEELMEKFAALEEEISSVHQSNNEAVYKSERDAVVEKDRLKKEMVSRVDQVAMEFRKVSNKQMAETNKRTIIENVELSGRLQRLSEDSLREIAENDRLRASDQKSRIDLEILETVERELMKKSTKNNNTIKYLIEECRESEENLAQYESEEREEYMRNVQSENNLLKQQTNSQNSEYDEIISERRQLTEKLTQLTGSTKIKLKQEHQIKRFLGKTHNVLLDAANLLDPDDELTEMEMLQKRQKMLQSLLLFMNSAATLGFAVRPADLGLQGVEPDSYDVDKAVLKRQCNQKSANIFENHIADASLITATSGPLNKARLAEFGLSVTEPGGTAGATGAGGTTALEIGSHSAGLVRQMSATTRLSSAARSATSRSSQKRLPSVPSSAADAALARVHDVAVQVEPNGGSSTNHHHHSSLHQHPAGRKPRVVDRLWAEMDGKQQQRMVAAQLHPNTTVDKARRAKHLQQISSQYALKSL